MLAVTNQAGDFWAYVGAGYGISAVVLIGYVVRTLRRARRLAAQLPPDQRRWM